jgi:8-hydroxy-5-deazaflavin:NADPH oxidoreductase
MAAVRIAVLGAGNIGGTLGRKWVAAGHQVTFGVANPSGDKAQALRADLGEKAVVRTAAEALRDAEVVVFAVPGGAMEETIAANAAALDGKLVIDAANRMGASTTNSRAVYQQHAPGARYVRAFNSLGWENFANPTFDGVQADLFYAGPEADRALVEQLIGDVGLRPIRLGDADQAGVVDTVLGLWFALAIGQKRGRHLAFKVLTS